MKNGKAVGEDGLTVDMIRAAGDTGVKWLHRLLCDYWDQVMIPMTGEQD